MIVPAEEEPLASTSNGPDRPFASVPQVQSTPLRTTTKTTAPRADNDNRGEAAAQGVTAPAIGSNLEPARDPRPIPAAESNYPQRITTLLGKASKDLKCVEYGKLSNDRKTLYDDSVRHAETATEKLGERNYDFALSAAEKAAAFAAALASSCPNR